MAGLFFSETPPTNYRDWKDSDYTFYDTLAPFLHDLGVLCEPDSREPWFISAAHDEACLEETLAAFEQAVDQTIETLGVSQADKTRPAGVTHGETARAAGGR
jgi:glutamate-1-semialdehyde 2,1-aminomutase